MTFVLALMLVMNLSGLRADFENDKAYATGTGKIIWGSPNSITLARRAALTDARRGLLILRRELKEGIQRRYDYVSGHVPPVNIISENESGDIYIVEVEAVLSDLMKEGEYNEGHENYYGDPADYFN